MNPFVPENEVTREGDLADWQAFALAYYEPILRALRLMRVSEGELLDLAHSFLLKAAERDFLTTFRAFRRRQEEDGRRVRFRTYLYRSIQNHVLDFHRQTGPGKRARVLDSDAIMMVADDPNEALDPDAIYALDVLHQAIQALRRHCERSGKPQYWTFFEETLLADEFRGRRAKSRAELLQAFPEFNSQRLENALTTAKRAFRRLVEELIPRGLREEAAPGERFEEWMEILRNSHASQFNLLSAAFRVMPYLDAAISHAASSVLVVEKPGGAPLASVYEEPSGVVEDDELGILAGFYLEMPLQEMIDPAELIRYFPPSSPWRPLPRGDSNGHHGGRHRASQSSRPPCLLTLIEPTPAELASLAGADLVGLLARVKLLAKQLHRRRDHTVPKVVSQLLYTIASVLAVLRCEVGVHTISADALAGNIHWFLEQTWLDKRVYSLLQAGLKTLGGPSDTGAVAAPPA